MKRTSPKWLTHALTLLLAAFLMLPLTTQAQDDGGEDKPKKEKPEKPPKEKKEKPPKEKKQKPPKEDKADKEEKSKSGDDEEPKAPKEKKSRHSDGDNDFSDELKGAGFEIPLDTSGTEEPPKDLIGGVDDTSRVSVPCWRYRSGYMEFIDKNYHGIKIKRTKKKEIHTNTNDGNKLIFKIVWESDYVYKLQFVKAKMPSRFKKGYSMTCKMTDCWDEYYDCDCALNGIVQYASVLKTLSPKELKAKAKEEEQKLKDAEDAAAKAAKKAEGGDTEEKEEKGETPKKEGGEKPEKNNGKAAGVKPEKNNGKAAGVKPEPVKKEKKKKEKKAKVPKEKKEKAPKEKKK